MQIFDMDGTLIDSNGIWKDVDTAFLAKRGLSYTKEFYEGVAHTIFPLAAKFTKEFCRLPESEEAIMAEWMELAKDNYAHVALKPHVREYLEKLRAQGERMAVFTSCVPAHCKTALAVHDLNRCFERVIFAQELGMDKSDPAIFAKATELLGVTPQECIFLGQVLPQRQGERHDGHRRVRSVFRGHEGRNAARLRPLHPRLW